MSPLDKQVPPTGEEIHLPGGSIQPLLVAAGITIALVGITFSIILVVLGSLLTVWTIIRWIQDTRREIDALPIHDHTDH